MPVGPLMTTKTKRCSCCEQTLPIADFGKNMQTPDGLSYYCRKCAYGKQQAYRKANPEAARAARRRYLDKLKERNRARAESPQ